VFIQESEVIDIKSIKYENFAPTVFIQQFYTLRDIPIRLQRYLSLGEVRIRREIINAFQLNQMSRADHEQNYFLWEEYNLKIKIDSISLSKVLH